MPGSASVAVELIAPTTSTEPVKRLALRYSHPAWIARDADALGGDIEELGRALAADNVRPEVTLVARPGRADVDELSKPARDRVAGRPMQRCWPRVILVDLAAVRERRAGIQDEGSQLVALALAAVQLAGSDERWLDMCAGPGGKAALLGGLATQRGAHDCSPWKSLAAPRSAGRKGAT